VSRTVPVGTQTVPAGTTDFEITGLLPGTLYTYTIQASNSKTIAPSMALTMAVYTQRFLAPTAGRAATGDVGLSSAIVRWASHPFADNGYLITWFDPANKAATLRSQTVPAGTTDFQIPNLQPGTRYTYTVQALNSKVAASSAALTMTVVTTAFAAPKIVAAVTGDIGFTSVILRWQPTAGATAYDVKCLLGRTEIKGLDIEFGTADGGKTITATITGLTPGQTYTFEIRGTNVAFDKPSVPLTRIATTPKLAAATLLAVTKNTLTATAVELTWKAPVLPAGIAGPITYELYYTTQPYQTPGLGTAWKKMVLPGDALVGDPTATFTGLTTAALTNLTPGTTYYIYVKAIWQNDPTASSNTTALMFKTLT